MISVKIQKINYSVKKEYSRIKGKKTGAVASFIGLVRMEKNLIAIKYDCHKEMALNQLTLLAKEVTKKFGAIDIIIIHRIGVIKPGERVILILVGTPHRAEAFKAVEWLINAIKKKVPIWKKELRKGDCRWV